MDIIAIIIMIFTGSYEIYNMFRKKYEVFGIILVPGKGATAVGVKKFRTYRKALDYYNDCRSQYPAVHMYEHV